ncbi:SprT family protein [Mesobacillus zeae]|uniref:Protein SprT-like n=1 Tax=Mesobacillus zeae TaxID=1917180 RepID=A0A398B2W9_9BACI|nr:SprT family protein [Mesobacillus zeae]RID84227.1 SprT family protein [Mesobacillus zeae]
MDNEQLQRLVETISLSEFKKPFRHEAFFNPRLRTTGGRYMLRSHNIEINKKYYEQFGEEELEGIIRHELCHYHLHLEGKGFKHRDKDFRELLAWVKAPRFCSELPGEKKKVRSTRIVVYKCAACGQVYNRKRSIDTDRFVCGKCRGKLMKVKVLTTK